MTALEEEYKGKFGPPQSPNCRSAKNLLIRTRSTAGYSGSSNWHENDVASDCSEEYIEDSVEKTDEDADGGLKSTLHCIHDLDNCNIALENAIQ